MFRRGKAFGAATAALTLVILLGSPAAAAPAQASLAEVLKALRTDKLPADYVVLLDVSSSMQPASGPDLYTSARQALRPLLEGLSPVDRLHLYAFADRPDPTFSGAMGDDGAGVLGQLPARAEGGRTDIGAAIEAAIEVIDDPLNSDPATVVLLTDGKQDAPAGSKYSGALGPPLQRLRQRAQGVEQRRPVRAIGIPLTGRTDVEMLDRVFDNAVLMDLPPDQVGPYLSRVGNRVAVDKAAAYVAQDRLSATITAEQDGITVRDDTVTVTAVVRSEATRVPLTLTGISAGVDGVSMPARVLSGDVALDPARREQVVRIELDPPAAGRWIGGERITSGTLRIDATVDSPWRDVIARDLGVPFSPKPITATVGIRAAANGIPVWQVVLAALAVAALTFVAVRARRRRWKPMSGGHLMVSEADAAAPYRQGLSGRKVTFPAPHGSGNTAGSGTVRATRERRQAGNGRELVLHIDYRRDGRRHRVTCRPRETQPLADGTTFSYYP